MNTTHHDRKGTTVKPTETVAKHAPTQKTGLFAMLRAVLRTQGSGAPTTSRRTGVFSVRRAGRAIKNNKSHFLMVFVGVLLVSALMATTALASTGHVFSSEFGTKGTGPGQLEDPTGIAVNNATGNVYVVDKGNNRVEEFNPEGAFVAEFNGSGTAGALSEPEAIAVDNSVNSADPSKEDVYVTDGNVIDKFEANGTYLNQITAGEGGASFQPLAGVAVDPKGQVWVYQKTVEIEGKQHTYIDAFGDAQANAFLSGRESKAGCEAYPGLAVDSEDNLYVAHACEAPHLLVAKLNSSGARIKGALGGEEQKTGVAVDPSNNDVYLDSVPTESGEPPEIEEFAPNGTEKIEGFGAKQLTDGGGTALAVSYAPVSSGDVYVVDSTAGKIDMFVPTKVTAYLESFSFGGKGTGSGELTEPLGVAVNDSTGLSEGAEDVYVVDKGNKRVEQFSKAGAFIRDFAAPPGGFNEPEDIAVDNCKNGLGEPCSKLEDPSVGDIYVTDQLPPPVEEYRNGVHYRWEAEAVYKFSSTGTYLSQLRRCPEDELQNGSNGCEPVGHPTSGFDAHLSGVAVGPEGNVWVNDSGVFSEGPPEFNDAEPNTFLESSESPVPVTGSSALDPATGELFVDRESSIDRYASGEESPSGLLETFPSAGGLQASQGIAVSPAGTVFATERTADDVKVFGEFPLAQVFVGAVSGLRPTSVTLQGSVTPEGEKVSSCEFEYGTTTSYGQIAACEPAAGSLGEGTEQKLVGATVSGLQSGTSYHYRLVASDASGTNASVDNTFTTPGPSVTDEQVTYVEAMAATLGAQIDPDGGATSYRFEYDTSPYTSSAAHGTSVPIPDTLIGSGTTAVPVSVRVTGLHPGTLYYYRAVAAGEPLGAKEAFYGLDQTFETNPGPAPTGNCPNEKQRAEQPFGLTLPDCRAYEMASPLETGGQDAVDPQGADGIRASLNGEAIAYGSRGSFAGPAGAAENSEFLSRRAGGAWSTRAITPPQEPLVLTTESYKASVFTPELTAGVADSTARLTNDTPKTVTGEDQEEKINKLYVTDLTEPLSEQSYKFVGEVGIVTTFQSPVGASTDLSHVAFEGGQFEGGAGGGISPALEWVNGTVIPVGVANDGEPVSASVGTAGLNSYGREQAEAWHAVSADGSRVYFTSPGTEGQSKTGQLYVRVNVGVKVEPEPEREQSKLGPKEECIEPTKACTIEVSASQRSTSDTHGLQAARFWGASTGSKGPEGAEDGPGPERVFFTSNAELTNDAYTGPEDNAPNLYEYEPGTNPDALGRLTDLTGETTDKTGNGAAVQGVVQISKEGQYVYFVAKGALATGASEQQCREETEGERTGKEPKQDNLGCNLYVSHEGGKPVFVAMLAAGDASDWQAAPGGNKDGGPANHTAVVDPSGARLAFVSARSLTGYDNEQAATGDCERQEKQTPTFTETGACREVYVYDAQAGTLVCASCDPTGARPVGPSNLGLIPFQLSSYRPRNFSQDGTLFFDSSDALAPHAKDGRQNVYEYEQGHVYPLSDVAGDNESTFLDADANGDNVFFASSDKLLPEDTSENAEVWDARVEGGLPVTVAPQACTTAEACRTASPPTPAVFGAPPSATFSGPGNITPPPPAVVTTKKKTATELKAEKLAKALKTCRKDKKKSKRQKCEKQARSKYGAAKKAKKSSNDRRASR